MHVLQTGSFKRKKEGKNQKLIQSSNTPDPEHNKITIKHHTKESQGVSPFPAGDHKVYNKQTGKHDKPETQKRKMIHKISTALERSVKVSNGAKIMNRYNQVLHLTQDTNGKVTNSQKTRQTRAKRPAPSQQATTKHTQTDVHKT